MTIQHLEQLHQGQRWLGFAVLVAREGIDATAEDFCGLALSEVELLAYVDDESTNWRPASASPSPLVFQAELEMPPKTVRRLVLGGPSEQGTAIHYLALVHCPRLLRMSSGCTKRMPWRWAKRWKPSKVSVIAIFG